MRIGLFFLAAAISAAPVADRPTPRRTILVFGAHADDVEQIAGGTFAKYIRELKYEGIYVVVINNSAGNSLDRTEGRRTPLSIVDTPRMFPADALETIQIRTEEARRAAALFPATPVFLNFREPNYWQGRKNTDLDSEDFTRMAPPGRQTIGNATRHSEDVQVVVDLLQKYQPEITITHTLGGDKYDHGNTGYMMYLAFRRAIQKGIPVGKLVDGAGWLAARAGSSRERSWEARRGYRCDEPCRSPVCGAQSAPKPEWRSQVRGFHTSGQEILRGIHHGHRQCHRERPLPH